MLKKTITYTDFNGDEASEDYYFHLSKAELLELEIGHEGGMQGYLQRIVAADDNAALFKEFKNIILLAYGVRTADGRRFVKNQKQRDEFESSEAYSTLIMELVTDTDSAIGFFLGIVPSDLSVEAAKEAGIDPAKTPIIALVDGDDPPEPQPEPEIISRSDLDKMSREDFIIMADRITKGEVKVAD